MTERKWTYLPYQYFFREVICPQSEPDNVVAIRKEKQMNNVTDLNNITAKDFTAIQQWVDSLPTATASAILTGFATIHAAYVQREYGTEQAYTAAWRDLLTGLKYGGQFFAKNQAA